MNEKNPVRPLLADAYKRWTLHMLYPSRYRMLAEKMPVQEDKIVFLEVRMKELTDSFIPVYRALKRAAGGRSNASSCSRTWRIEGRCAH